MAKQMILEKLCKCGKRDKFSSGGLQPRCLNREKALKAGWKDNKCPDCKRLVIRWMPQFSLWYLCHAKNYQNDFGNDVNGFETRGEAAEHAKQHGYEVEKHSYDQLQNSI